MAETIKIAVLSGGVSKQPAHMRLANQTETADNVVFSVLDGCSKRPGSRFVCAPTLTSGQIARMHAIHRDDTEKYNVLVQRVTTATVQVRTAAGTDCPVYISGASQAYLDSNSADADDYRLVTIADYTIVGNTNVPMAALTSPLYLVAGDSRDFDTLVSKTPPTGSYWRTRNDSVTYPIGHFQYLPGGNTYATIKFNNTSGAFDDVTAFWNLDAFSPFAFTMFFSLGGSAQTGATYTTATRTLTKTGQFANVSAGDWVNITGGTGAAAGYYQIESKTSADTVIITVSAGGSNQTNYTFDGVGKVAWSIIDMQQRSPADMFEVAKELERAIRDSLGGLPACVEWIKDGTEGKMIVTHPYAGTSATFPATAPTRTFASQNTINPTVVIYPAGVTAATDITDTATDVFYGASGFTVVAGGGDAGPTTTPVLDRWVRKPAPSQPEAVLDETKMPQQMIRLNPAGTYTGGYSQFTDDLEPFAYWRLGEAGGTIAADEQLANNGTYVNAPTFAATGALNGVTNTAVTFNGSNEYVDVGALPGWGPGLSRPFTIECWIKTSAATKSMVFACGSNIGTGYIRLSISEDAGGSNNSGYIYAELHDNAAHSLSVVSNAATLVNNGSYHHLVVTFNPASQTAAIYLDGVAVASTTTPTGTCTSFQEFNSGECAIATRLIISSATAFYLAGTLDEVAIYQGGFSAAMAAARYNQGNSASYVHLPIFGVFPAEWTPRLSGDELTNPLPSAIKDSRTLSDTGFFRNRLVLAANEQVLTSQDGDFFNLFLDDHDNITDSDPVVKSLSTRQVTIIDFLTEVRKSLLVTTRAGRQFELGTGTNEQFTPVTGSLAQSTSKQTINGVRPAVLDTFAYLPATRGSFSALYEYQSQEAILLSNANEVSAHVEGYMPTLRTVVTCGNENFVICLGSDSIIYVYRFFYVGDRKEMSAWARWTFSEAYTVRDITVIGQDLFLLVNSASTHTIERIPLARVAAETNFPWVVNTDRTFAGLSGSFGGGNTTWTIPVSDSTINRVVTSAGIVHTATTVGTTVTVAGVDLSAATVLIGRSYDMSSQLSRAYRRDANGVANLATEVDHRETVIRYTGSGDFSVAMSGTGFSTRTDSLSVAAGSVSSGEKQMNHVGNSAKITLTITSSDCRPVTISSIDYIVDTTPRSNP